MKVFISWSGSRSKDLANALRQWLPMVLQYVEPWVSDKDISAGERWAQAIAGELESANFGIICITPENINSEWILFEAGALSKSMLDGKVIPLLFGLELSDLSGPLSQFQAQKIEQTGVMEVVKAINKVAEKPASQQIVDQLVPTLWPQLQETLANIPAIAPSEKHKRPSHEILEELVTGVRGLSSRMRDLDPEMSEKERYYRRRKMRLHPGMIEDFAFMSGDNEDSPTALLLLAGILREDFPWLAELLAESYREIGDGNPEEIEISFNRLRQIVKNLTHHPMMRELSGNSKESMMFAEELPMFWT
jgi:TIR domain